MRGDREHSPDLRRRMIRRKKKNAKLEMRTLWLLKIMGSRYHLNRRYASGCYDISLPARQKVVEFMACFWHERGRRVGGALRANPSFWSAKLASNVARNWRKFVLSRLPRLKEARCVAM